MGVRPAVRALPWLLAALACDQGGTPAAGGSALPPPVLDDRVVLPAGKAPVAGQMHNPQAGDARAARAGEGLFSSMNCDGCHGGGATGWVGPSLVDGRWRYGGADGSLFQSIYYGRPKGMPAYGGILPPSSIWALVTYIRSQPVPPEVPTERW
jgi:cytochrome c oxidase cbb3-type subunit 3